MMTPRGKKWMRNEELMTLVVEIHLKALMRLQQ